MNVKAAPIGESPRSLRRQLLNDNRFLGLHQVWFGLLLTPASLAMLSQFTPLGWHRLIVPGVLLAWLCVELLFLPRRLMIHRVARRQDDAAIIREARRHDLHLSALSESGNVALPGR